MGDGVLHARVLVVDDEVVIGDTLATILRMHGFDASTAYSGEAALHRAERFNPDIVLSDIRMGQMDGVEAARRVRVMQPECRVVLLSGAPVEPTLWDVIDRHGFEYLSKPIHPVRLVAHLRGNEEVEEQVF